MQCRIYYFCKQNMTTITRRMGRSKMNTTSYIIYKVIFYYVKDNLEKLRIHIIIPRDTTIHSFKTVEIQNRI